ncbi:hypothetical protein BON30_13455 [Cystobacter ferrugineus]|uniref:VIT domain-containing protein n=1 Tax=Cystobacter ferrugineus TaxID=83449 RepID=A0A1L9BCT4_9BACT|nr:hypothetical protein BON30_13455 [Cystobacter ferrugineus]
MAEDAGSAGWNEVTHRVEARISGEVVDLTVLRTFHNPSRHFLEQEEFLELPRGGSVNGFAFEAQGRWTDGVLLDAKQARDRYKALRHEGPAAPLPVAWLSGSGGWMMLRMLNVPPRGSVTVRYTLRTRLGYAEGRRTFSYPLSINEDAPRPSLTVVPPHTGSTPRIVQAKGALEVSWAPERPTRVEARAGQVALGSGALGFIQIQAPPRLSPVPVRARVVFVVDASHSVGPEGITQQLAVASAYLQQLPDATAEVVVFRRAAERLFGRFIPASDWKDTLAAVPPARLAPGNGSHLDEGLRLAQRVLATGDGPARVLALSDGHVRQAYEAVPPAPVTSASDAAVHLLLLDDILSPTFPSMTLTKPPVRGACGEWKLLPREGPPSSKELESLVRPVRWDNLRLENAQGHPMRDVPTLSEGQGHDVWMWLPETTPLPLTLRGEAWRCPVSVRVDVDPALSADLGRHSYATLPPAPPPGADDGPVEKARRRLATAGDWVSEDRSFLALPPGAGPSSARKLAMEDPIEEGGMGSGVISGLLCCETGSLEMPMPGVDPRELDAELERLLRAAITACPRGSKPLQVQVESTRDEIIDVRVVGAASPGEEACVREAAWALRLGVSFKGDTTPLRQVTLRP